ncbi:MULTISPECIES: hypothetical protein [Microbacterium]|uniref:hypothetical protein n=1 Tax=Microbacterium TaxID=33882 RepID=UPI0011241DDD|nr:MULTISPECIES: hypothetical protein [Microbacterium]NJI59767.1 hypothetical protein [Microbacterium sp. B19(2022)]
MIPRPLQPDLETAEARYDAVLRELHAYARFVDEHGDEDGSAYESLSARVRQLTGKDTSSFNLAEWWEGEGAEVLAFRLSLPAPPTITLGSDDIRAVVQWLKTPRLPRSGSFADEFEIYLDDYYYELLRKNCSRYDHRVLFGSRRSPDGTRTEMTVEEAVEWLTASGKPVRPQGS